MFKSKRSTELDKFNTNCLLARKTNWIVGSVSYRHYPVSYRHFLSTFSSISLTRSTPYNILPTLFDTFPTRSKMDRKTQTTTIAIVGTAGRKEDATKLTPSVFAW